MVACRRRPGGRRLHPGRRAVLRSARTRTSSPSLHAAIETAGALMSLLAAHLMYGRFRRTGERRDLAVATSLAVLASANLVFSAMPAVDPEPPDTFADLGAARRTRAGGGDLRHSPPSCPTARCTTAGAPPSSGSGPAVAALVVDPRRVRGRTDDRLPQPFAALTPGEHDAGCSQCRSSSWRCPSPAASGSRGWRRAPARCSCCASRSRRSWARSRG